MMHQMLKKQTAVAPEKQTMTNKEIQTKLTLTERHSYDGADHLKSPYLGELSKKDVIFRGADTPEITPCG